MPAASSAKTVLVVDDDVQITLAIQRRLSRSGFHVVTAASAQEALDRARLHEPDAITLDVRLPDFDGLEVEFLLRQDASTRAIPVIFITGHIDRNLKDAAGSSRNLYFIRKPYDPDLLVRLLNSALAER